MHNEHIHLTKSNIKPKITRNTSDCEKKNAKNKKEIKIQTQIEEERNERKFSKRITIETRLDIDEMSH